MAFNLVRAGGGAVLGIASGILNPGGPVGTGVQISNTGGPSGGALIVGFDTIAELSGAVVGAGLQMLSPMTLPSLADGLVDGGIALLSRRVSAYVTDVASGKPAPGSFWQGAGAMRAAPARFGNVHNGTAGLAAGNARPVQVINQGYPTLRVG